MAFWGMDLNQSDEFCEIYNEYMDLYDIGLEPAEITQQMLQKYQKEATSLPLIKKVWLSNRSIRTPYLPRSRIR